jgi:DNA-binding Xre family transcriptional regulator
MIRLRVRECAEAKGISRGKLNRLSDIDPNTLKRLYRDPFTNVSIYTLDKIARALGVDVRDLIETLPDPPSEV